jgi:hypothetical protein
VEQFLADRPPKRPELACAVLLLTLDLAPGWDKLRDGDWIDLASAHVYAYFDGSGYGPARIHHLMERFVRWLHERGSLDAWEHRYLLHHIDCSRDAHGLALKGHPVVKELHLPRFRIDELAALFAEDLGLGREEQGFAKVVLRGVAAAAGSDCVIARFGSLVPEEMAVWMRERRPNVRELDLDPSTIAELDRDVLSCAATFYRWLGETGRLDAERADDLANRLGRLAQAAGQELPAS